MDLVEQPYVLDRNHRLVGEGRDQFDLLLGKRPDGGSLQDDDADRSAFAEERDPKRRTHIELPVKYYVIRIGPNIWDMRSCLRERLVQTSSLDPRGSDKFPCIFGTRRSSRMTRHVGRILQLDA
jgi:hypothetical protein